MTVTTLCNFHLFSIIISRRSFTLLLEESSKRTSLDMRTSILKLHQWFYTASQIKLQLCNLASDNLLQIHILGLILDDSPETLTF